MTPYLHQDGFPLVRTSGISQTLKIPVALEVFEEQLTSEVYGVAALATGELLRLAFAGKVGRQEVAGRLLAHP